ncbi:MAG TPA: 50S ribosomal protein L33 [Candidatus Aquirickettsiella sp.]|jgi:large subunit ribosomal protein L33
MRDKIKLKSPVSAYFYTTTKNKKTTPHKLKFKKYDPITRKHELFEEEKIK